MDWQIVAAVLIGIVAVVTYYLIGDRRRRPPVEADLPGGTAAPKPVDPEIMARFQKALREQQPPATAKLTADRPDWNFPARPSSGNVRK